MILIAGLTNRREKNMEYYPDLSFNEQEEFNKLINEYRVSDGTHFFIIDDKNDSTRYNDLLGKKLKHLKQKGELK